VDPAHSSPRSGRWNEARHVPGWARGLGVIVVGPRDRIRFMNRHAERLLGRTWEECRDRHCSGFVCSVRASGQRTCEQGCAIRRLAENAREIPPIQIRCPGERGRRLLMTSVPLEIDGSGTHILHIFLGIQRDILLREHARLAASRSLAVKVSAERPPRSLLTRRERDVLEHLAQDEEPKRVAAILCRSPATVRNHVRHILKKLGAHSIDEAVAMHLLYDPMP